VADASNRTGGTLPRILAGLLLIAAIAAVGTGVRGATATTGQDAGDGVDGNAYTSPSYGYTVSWDELVWNVAAERSDDGADYLELGDVTSTLAFEGTTAYTNLDDCVRGEIDELEEIETTSEIDRDRDLVDAIEAGENARVVVVTYTIAPLEDQVFENAKSIECRPLVAGEAILAITQIVAQEDFADETERRNEVVGALELDDASDEENEEATEESDAEPTARSADEDPEEEPTEEADDGPIIDLGLGDDTPTADPDDEPEDEPEDEPTEEADPPLAGRSGVDGDTYVGPNWGYGIAWDDEIWTVEDEDAPEDYDFLQLGTPRGTLYLEAFPDFGGDAEVCLATALDGIEDTEGVSDLTLAENGDGDPIRDASEDTAYAVYTFSFQGRDGGTIEFGNLIECRTLVPGEVVLEISYLTQVDIFNDEIEDVQDVLETIELPVSEPEADEDEAETPAANEDDAEDEDEPTEEPDAEPTEESDDEADEDEARAEPTEES